MLGGPAQDHPLDHLGVLDIRTSRNAFGRQLRSFEADLDLEGLAVGPLHAVFIRAPKIRRTGPQVKVLAEYNGDPVLVEQGPHLVATFHPELTNDSRVHKLFLSKV